MYYIIGELDVRNDYARRAYGNEQDMHRCVMRMFENKRVDEGVLYRVFRGHRTKILIQSINKPDVKEAEKAGIKITAVRCIDEMLEKIEKDSIMCLNMYLSPAKSEKKEGWSRSKRVSIDDADKRLEWVKSKLEQGGCEVPCVDFIQETKVPRIYFSHGKNEAKVPAYDYKVCVKIKDTEKFIDMFKTGIGSEKAYGLGMILFT